MSNFQGWLRTLAVVAGVVIVAAATADDKKKDAKHEHPSEGPHHGVLIEWGEEEYHVEFVVDHKAQTATAYILDGSGKKAKPIDAKELTLMLKQKPPVTMKMMPKPESGEKAGQSSRFTAKNAVFAKEAQLEGTISGKVGSKPYSGDFKQTPHDHKH